MNSWKVEVLIDGGNGNWWGDAIRYGSQAQAETAAKKQADCWRGRCRDWRVVPTEDQPNDRIKIRL